VPPRAHRRNKRGVKRKMSSFPVRRKADRPPPPIDMATAIRILRPDHLDASPTSPASSKTSIVSPHQTITQNMEPQEKLAASS
jgi:hypothetical protein